MSIEVGALHLAITAPNVTKVEQALKRLDAAAGKTASTMTTAEAGVGKLKSALASLAIAGTVAAAFHKLIASTSEAQAAQAQLGATLKSTGYAAGQSLQALNDHAAALQRMTTFGDDAINGAQALLLTFTRIQGDVFPKATLATLNVAQAMGTDLKSAAIQVGKALNDPIAGVNALARSGIQFTEQQKDQIKTLVESGRIVEAQTIILKELEAQFGGSAAAARTTLGGAIKALQNAFGDLFEVSQPGTAELVRGINDIEVALVDLKSWLDSSNLLPAFARELGLLIRGIGDAVRWFGLLGDQVDATGRMIEGARDVVKGLTLGNSTLIASGKALVTSARAEYRAIQERMEAIFAEGRAREYAARTLAKYQSVVSGAMSGPLTRYGQTGAGASGGGAGGGKTQLELLVDLASAAPITAKEYAALEAAAKKLDAELKRGTLSMEQRIKVGKDLAAVESALGAARVRYTVSETAANFATKVRKAQDAMGRNPAGGFTVKPIDPGSLKMGQQIKPVFNEARAQFLQEIELLKIDLAQGFGGAIVDAFARGFETAFASNSIGEGFKALGASLLSGLGTMMIEFGKAALIASTLMDTIFKALKKALPGGAIVASLAMIAAGAAIRGAAARAFGGSTGGTSASPSGGMGSLGVGGPAAPNPYAFAAGSRVNGMTFNQRAAEPRTPVTVNATIIGPNDVNAQRAIKQLVSNAERRGIQ